MESQLGNALATIALEMERYARVYRTLFDERLSRDGVLADGALGVLKALRVLALGPTGIVHRDHLEVLISAAALTAGFPESALTDY